MQGLRRRGSAPIAAKSTMASVPSATDARSLLRQLPYLLRLWPKCGVAWHIIDLLLDCSTWQIYTSAVWRHVCSCSGPRPHLYALQEVLQCDHEELLHAACRKFHPDFNAAFKEAGLPFNTDEARLGGR